MALNSPAILLLAQHQPVLAQRQPVLAQHQPKKWHFLKNIPGAIKIPILFLFFFYFYKIFFDIFTYWGANTNTTIIYMSWFAALLLFILFLKQNRSDLYE